MHSQKRADKADHGTPASVPSWVDEPDDPVRVVHREDNSTARLFNAPELLDGYQGFLERWKESICDDDVEHFVCKGEPVRIG